MTTIGFDNIVLDTLNHRGAKYSDLKVATLRSLAN